MLRTSVPLTLDTCLWSKNEERFIFMYGSGLAAQTERLDSLITSLGKHTGDKQLLQQTSRKSSPSQLKDMEEEQASEGDFLLDVPENGYSSGTEYSSIIPPGTHVS